MNDTFKVEITRREFLTLPMETRRRILSEQVNSSKEQIDALNDRIVHLQDIVESAKADERARTLKEVIEKLNDYFGRDGRGKPHGRATLARQMAKRLVLNLILEPIDKLKQGRLP